MPNFLISVLIFIPILGSFIILFIPNKLKKIYQITTIVITFLQLLVALVLYFSFDNSLKEKFNSEKSFQFTEKITWIQLDMGDLGSLSIDYFVGIDGLGLAMVLLSGIVLFVGAVASWTISEKEKGFFALYLLLCGSIMGCFVALDFFLFYLFFEFMLLPMYFLIGIWGGIRREYAAIKFFIYTLVGSLLILIVMIGLYLSAIDPLKTAEKIGIENFFSKNTQIITQEVQDLIQKNNIKPQNYVHTFNIPALSDKANYISDWRNESLQKNNNKQDKPISLSIWAFLLLLIGFAIKLPVVPLHTWLPDAHVESPTPVSVVLAGILLKIGAYGIFRICYGIFPEMAVEFAVWIGFFGVLSILYGGLNALAQSDLKKMIAYSSISHMGFVLLGFASLTSEGLNGAVFQMFSHGILSAMLFLIAGVLYDRTHNRDIEAYQGLIQKMPQYATLVMIAFFASLGLPVFSAFIGEFFTIAGSLTSKFLPIWFGILSAFGIVLSAAYFLWTYQKMFLGDFYIKDKSFEINKLTDLNLREKFLLCFLAILTLILGLFPHLIFNSTNNTIQGFMEIISK